jgi:hypothetical protein
MGKICGVIGGFVIGWMVMAVFIGIIYAIMSSYFETKESMMTADGKAIALIGIGYVSGWLLSIYLGYGFSYNTGLEDCQKLPR